MLIPIICFILERNYHKDLFFFVVGVGSGDLSAAASRAATFEANLPLPREGQLCERKLNRHGNVTNDCLSISALPALAIEMLPLRAKTQSFLAIDTFSIIPTALMSFLFVTRQIYLFQSIVE